MQSGGGSDESTCKPMHAPKNCLAGGRAGVSPVRDVSTSVGKFVLESAHWHRAGGRLSTRFSPITAASCGFLRGGREPARHLKDMRRALTPNSASSRSVLPDLSNKAGRKGLGHRSDDMARNTRQREEVRNFKGKKMTGNEEDSKTKICFGLT